MALNNKYVGLSDKEVLKSRNEYGSNELPKEKRIGFWKQFAMNFGDPIIKVLLAALAMNLLFTLKNFNWFESIGIVIAIITATLVSTLSEYGSEIAFDKLQKEASESVCRVMRNGKTVEIPVVELVRGDIVYLFAGDEPIGFLHSPRHFAVKSGADKVLCRNIRRERRRCRSSCRNTRDLQNIFRKAVHTIILSFPLIISAKRY